MTHYFKNDENLKIEEKEIKVKINNNNFTFITDNGVFSKKGLDFGTRTLLESLPLTKLNGIVLDLGCGYGPIGIYVKKNTKSEVHMIDINLRSLKLAKKNAVLNKVDVNIYESDGYSKINQKFNYIISNPPIRVGKKKLYELLFEAKKYLLKKGELWIVVNKNQGAKTLVHDLQKEYQVEIVKKNKGFYIIKAINN